MITVRCIQKFRDSNNNIYGYIIEDYNGKTMNVSPDALKNAIRAEQIVVTNLRLTSDNRLVDSELNIDMHNKLKSNLVSKEGQKAENIIAKAKLIGAPIKTIDTACEKKCIILTDFLQTGNHIILIPDEVSKLNLDIKNLTFTKKISGLTGKLTVIGGNNLVDTDDMFNGCKITELDLSNFKTDKAKSMRKMFAWCKAEKLLLGSFNTSNVTNMNLMFGSSMAKEIDLHTFDTKNVANMELMFTNASAEVLDLSSFKVDERCNTKNMFSWYLGKVISNDKRIITEYNEANSSLGWFNGNN